MNHIFTTIHGAQSMRSRLNVPKKRTDKRALEALDKGMPREETGGDLRRWIDHVYFNHERRGKYVIWTNFLWIFADDSLVTCYAIPGRMNDTARLQRQKWLSRPRELSKTGP